MKPRLTTKRNAAMSLFEVGIIVAVVMVLAVVFFPRLSNSPRRYPPGINCVNNLKQIGLAYKIWEGDNGDIFPMGVSITNGGSMESVVTGNVVSTFQVMSNELGTTKILICPNDAAQIGIYGFNALSNSNISYFVGVDVTNDSNPQLILSGDCNFEIRGVPVKSGLQSFGTNDPVDWSAARHVHAGNIGLTDGSVQYTTTSTLRNLFVETGLATNRLAIP